MPESIPRNVYVTGLGCSLCIGSFQSSPNDSNVQPRLRTTILKQPASPIHRVIQSSIVKECSSSHGYSSPLGFIRNINLSARSFLVSCTLVACRLIGTSPWNTSQGFTPVLALSHTDTWCGLMTQSGQKTGKHSALWGLFSCKPHLGVHLPWFI